VSVTVTPKPDTIAEPAESVTLTLIAQPFYMLGTARNATVTIQ
jgi:hypothetical protein